jgi:hypothetical protein
MNIFPKTPITKEEELLLAEIFRNPTVVKYLNLLAYNLGANLLTAPILNEAGKPDHFLAGAQHVQGGLAVLETLLSISNQPAPPTN